MIYLCCDERRRQAVKDHLLLNGIDFLEVVDLDAPADSPRQRTLLVRFLTSAPALTVDNVAITGGERIPDVEVQWVTRADAPDPTLVTASEQALLAALPEPEKVLVLRTDSSGDHSTYTLHLVASSASLTPPPGIDPLLARVAFSFKVECPADFDCAPGRDCPEPPAEEPVISYLAKDYRSFRRLMLERMAQIMPTWTERHAADLGIALVELMAYVGDRLSYTQDAVATEAYLLTARRRTSVRRLARLVDYAVHDGANARAWVQVAVDVPQLTLAQSETKFLTRLPGTATQIPSPASDPAFGRLLQQGPTVFEPMHDATLFQDHNELFFYTWGDAECCLPKGATRATLQGDHSDLTPGHVLVFEEILGPLTGRAADADPAKRHAVRLTQVASGLTDPLPQPPVPITEIRWHEDDALPFALCISARTCEEAGNVVVEPVSRALGNIVLADHGLSVAAVDLGTVPEPHLFVVVDNSGERCTPVAPQAVPPRYRPSLEDAPLTQAGPYDAERPPASAFAARQVDPRTVMPQIGLTGTTPTGPETWTPRRDLLQSRGDDRHFAVEIERDGTATLRFGDDRHALRPASGTRFAADYRVGNGPDGNIGADAIGHVASDLAGIVGARNPLPAVGGTAPESVDEVRQRAPHAFRTPERAVTEEDYAEVSRRHPDVQRAAATFRWNGHGHTVFVTVDRFGGRPITAAFEDELRAFLEPFRMAGYDLEIDAPHFVSLEIDLFVCAAPDHFRADVRVAILQALSNRLLPDGRRGLFHPDNLTFGQSVYLSAIVAAAQAVEGVESVTVTKFERMGMPDPVPLDSGVIELGRLEIARLDNDPDYPEHGVLRVTMGGGK